MARRIEELEGEWSIERWLEMNASGLAFSGVVLGLLVNRKFFAIPCAVLLFLFQHAVHSVPDRSHGYCVDDNARALLLACALNNPGEARLSEVLTARFAAFVQHAWNPDTRRFRNFMGFNRTWLEDTGSEDSHGRTLWALGECARHDASGS